MLASYLMPGNTPIAGAQTIPFLGFGEPIVGPILSNENGWADPTNYLTIQYPDINGDTQADLCGRANAGIVCWLSTGDGFGEQMAGPELSDANAWNDEDNYLTIRYPDINGDTRADLCGRANAGIFCWLSISNL